MQRVDQTADDSTPCWGEDTIYCEAICQPKDILYEGSDDDDYDSPTSRRLRYEAAGQRFLDGIEPFLLTATLKGPFDKASGWVNPWRSKHRTAQGSQPILTSQERPLQQPRFRRTVSISETTQDETQDSLDCHLPSPESIKQVSVVNSHPFLLEEDLVKVQNWRHGVEPISSAKDRFWVTTPQGNESARKRKARGSDWLKKLATKRRRTSLMESGSINTPVPRRSHTDPTLLQNLTDDNPSDSFDSARGQHPSSASQPVSRRPVPNFGSTVKEEDDEDELTTLNYNSILSSTQPNTSVRRISPRREIQPTRDDRTNLEDELSQEQIAAAATLSSPVSQRTHPKSSMHQSSFQMPSSQVPLEQQSPTRRKSSAPTQLPRDHNGHVSTAQVADDADDQEKAVEAFESQRDQSFCFKMRPKFDGDAEHLPTLDLTATYNEEHTWSGLSSEGSLSSHSTDEVLVIAQSTASIENDADTNDDDSSSSSDLSSLLSRYFEGFHTPGPESEGHMDVDTTETTEDGVREVIEVASEKRQPDSSNQGGDQASATPISQQSPPPALPTIQHISPIELRHMSEIGDVETSSNSSLTTLDDEGDEDDGDDDNDVNETTPSKKPTDTFDGPKRAGGNIITPKFSRGALLLKSSVRQCMSSPLPNLRKMGSAPPTLRTKPSIIKTTQQDDLSTASEESSEEGSEDDDRGGNWRSPAASTSAPGPGIEVIPQSPIFEPIAQTPVLRLDQKATSKAEGSQEQPQIVEENQELVVPLGQEMQEATASDNAENMDVDPVESQVLPVSQQSPWAGTKLSQVATLAIEHLSQEEEASSQTNASTVAEHTVVTSPKPQSPWSGENSLPMVNKAFDMKTDMPGAMSSIAGFSATTDTPLRDSRGVNHDTVGTSFMTPRPSTPEPQFTVKSFASFMSPSPERRTIPRQGASWRGSGSRLPSTQGILASALKNPWSARSNRSGRRVSWKPLPNESEDSAIPEVASSIQVSSEPRERASSPPPIVPVADLPTSQSEKFHDHFKAVIRRRNNQALLPTESQRTLGSPDPQAMAEKFIEADDVVNYHSDEITERADTESLPKSSSFKHSQDSADIVEDIFREMSDYLETWNVDTELDSARRDSSVQTPLVEPSAQSPW